MGQAIGSGDGEACITRQCALSANDVLSAHVVNTVLRLDGDHQARFLAAPVNLRRLLDLPDGTVGNLFGDIYLPRSTQDGPASLAAPDLLHERRDARRDLRLAVRGGRPAFVGMTAHLPLARIGWITEGFGGDGYLVLIAVPAALAARLRGAAGQEALHPFREPADTLPPLAGAVRRLA
jgi:hypothetical protein